MFSLMIHAGYKDSNYCRKITVGYVFLPQVVLMVLKKEKKNDT